MQEDKRFKSYTCPRCHQKGPHPDPSYTGRAPLECIDCFDHVREKRRRLLQWIDLGDRVLRPEPE